MAFIDSSALNVALPAIQSSLQASGAQLLWVINGYLLMLAALILVGGSLGDRYGRKKIFMLGIFLFIIASFASGLSPSIQWLIFARIIQGVGGSLMIPGSLAIITACIIPGRRGRAIGTWSATTTLVTIAGPILGGFLADHGLWRGVFLINVPLGILALIVLYLKVPESRDQTAGPIDIPGAFLVTIGLAGVTYGFINAPDLGFGDWRVFGTLLIGVLALIAFVWVEARRKYPMMPLGLFKSRAFSGTNLLTLLLYGALSVVSFFFSLNLIQIQGYTKTEAGFSFLPFAICLTLLSRWTGGLADRIGPRLPLVLGPSLVGIGFFWLGLMGLTHGPSAYWTTYFPGILLFGIGMGFTVAPLSNTVMGSAPPEHVGTASGINNAVSRTAGVLAIAIIGSIALLLFSRDLQAKTANLNLAPKVQASLKNESQKLGGASVPADVPPGRSSAVENDIKLGFVETFRMVMFICAALALLSALSAALFLAPGKTPAT